MLKCMHEGEGGGGGGGRVKVSEALQRMCHSGGVWKEREGEGKGEVEGEREGGEGRMR